MILLAYSFLEGYLEDLAAICSVQFSNNKQEEIQGINIDIERSKVQIESLTNCNFEKYSKEWKRIHLFREVRNCLLHFNSNIGRMGNRKLLNRLERSKEFEITKYGFIRIKSYKYIYEFLETIYKYLEGVLIILSNNELEPISIVTDWEQQIKELINKYPDSEYAKYFKSKYKSTLFK